MGTIALWAGSGFGMIDVICLQNRLKQLTCLAVCLFACSVQRPGMLSAFRYKKARKEVNRSGHYAPGLPVPVLVGLNLWAFTAARTSLEVRPSCLFSIVLENNTMTDMNRILARTRNNASCRSCPLVRSVPLKQAEFCAVAAMLLAVTGLGLNEKQIDSMLETFFEAREIFLSEEVEGP